MTYVEFLRKAHGIAKARKWPWLCEVAVDTPAACAVDEYAMAAEHSARLLYTIRAQVIGHAFLTAALRAQRPGWPYPDADGKAIRLAWLREQIELAEAEEAGAYV